MLVVDDEAMLRKTTSRLLEALGYSVLQAGDGNEAEAVLREVGTIDVILLDLIMPGRTAEQTFEALRQVKPGVSIILCSGYAPEDMAERLLQEPAVRHLQKPFTLQELGEMLTAVLAAPA